VAERRPTTGRRRPDCAQTTHRPQAESPAADQNGKVTSGQHGEEQQMSTSLTNTTGRSLTALDRCDRCSARAVVETIMVSGASLFWCGHHFGHSQDALLRSGATVVIDERHI
jgi:hypothetical protein